MEGDFMKKKYFCIFNMFIVLILFGCSITSNSSDKYLEVKEIAWDYLVENKWESSASSDLEDVRVKKVQLQKGEGIINDTSYIGKEVLLIDFKEKENTVASPPRILIDPDSNKVIGHISGE
jgi:hypothetical protein